MEAANACLTTHGGYGFATEYDVERKFRETRLLTVAPVSNNLVLAYLGQHVLGMPKSYRATCLTHVHEISRRLPFVITAKACRERVEGR